MKFFKHLDEWTYITRGPADPKSEKEPPEALHLGGCDYARVFGRPVRPASNQFVDLSHIVIGFPEDSKREAGESIHLSMTVHEAEDLVEKLQAACSSSRDGKTYESPVND